MTEPQQPWREDDEERRAARAGFESRPGAEMTAAAPRTIVTRHEQREPTTAGPSGRISLALVIHNHQPVGNFDSVIAEVHERAYRPFVEALERHPLVRCALHYSGPLLRWLRAERPGFLDRVKALVERGQVEILGGGWAEPILVSLPEPDRIAQLRRLGDEIEAWLGRRPTGAWLAERVWEPDLPVALVDAGYAWTVLDDHHFRAAAIDEGALWGPYATDDQGRRLIVFGSDQELRYRIPFRAVSDVIEYLRSLATPDGERLATMGDDGEKFGAWPTTHEHCWGPAGWVDALFASLEANADWLRTTTPSAWLAEHAPIGRAAIPTASYAEMGEWALPADEARAYAATLARLTTEERSARRWLRGASWRNFLVKYREANELHKQMLRVSAKVGLLAEGPDRNRAHQTRQPRSGERHRHLGVDGAIDAASRHLLLGQSNDAYWHGLFGGLYLSHLRLAVAGHLIAAEDIADRLLRRTSAVEVADVDLDGRQEILLSGAGQVVLVAPEGGGGIVAWDIRAARHALAAVLRRRPEAYHARLLEAQDATSEPGAGVDEPGGSRAASGVASIHELTVTKEPDLAARLVYDDHELRSGLARLVDPAATADAWRAGQTTEVGTVRDGAYDVVVASPEMVVLRRLSADRDPRGSAASGDGGTAEHISVEKTIRLGGGRLDPELGLEVIWANEGRSPTPARPALEWSFMLLGGGGNPAAFWEIDGERTPHDAPRQATRVSHLRSGNADLGLTIETQIDPPAEVWIAPIETVSNSESGIERTYQGSQLLCLWPAGLLPGERRRVTVRHQVRVERDLLWAEGLTV